MTLGDLISFKENNIHHVFTVITLRWPLCVLFCIPFLPSTPSHFFMPASLSLCFPPLAPFIVPMQVGLLGPLCCLICTAHSCSFIIVPLAAEALFLVQTMGGVVTESTVVMSHLPPRAISLSGPPSHPPSAFQ